jgi:hypothetical protein
MWQTNVTVLLVEQVGMGIVGQTGRSLKQNRFSKADSGHGKSKRNRMNNFEKCSMELLQLH